MDKAPRAHILGLGMKCIGWRRAFPGLMYIRLHNRQACAQGNRSVGGGRQCDEKDRQYAPMGLARIFEHHHEKGSIVADLGLCGIFPLLHSLVPVFCRPGLGHKIIFNQRLELVRDDGPHYLLVLDKFKVA